MMERYTTGTGLVLNVHTRLVCAGNPCVIHSPLPGPWQSWPTHWRDDRRIMERLCDHGVGHPAAEYYGQILDVYLYHGCCGCPCAPGSA